MLTEANYRGVYVYSPTPFLGDLSLDIDGLQRNLRNLIRLGVDGIVLAGTTGEFYTLNEAEFRQIAEVLSAEVADHDVQGVIGTTSLNTRETIKRTRVAVDAGVDGVLIAPPFYLPLTDNELVNFWTVLGESCPEVGMILYRFDWIRQDYSPDVFERLAPIPNLVGTKDGHWDFEMWLRMHKESPLVHMSATDVGWMVELFRNGAVGVGSTLVSLMPHIVRDVLRLCTEGELGAAEKALMPLTEFASRMMIGSGKPNVFPTELPWLPTYSGVARFKVLTDIFGFLSAGPPRLPAIPVTSTHKAELEKFIGSRYPELVPPAGFVETIEPGSRLWGRPDV